MESPISTKDNHNDIYVGHQDRKVESRLVDRAKDVLEFCGLKEKTPRLEAALDQVHRRLCKPSKLVHPSNTDRFFFTIILL